jgi:hypothetical protein
MNESFVSAPQLKRTSLGSRLTTMCWGTKMHEQRLLLVALTLAMGELGCRPGPGEPGLKWTKTLGDGGQPLRGSLVW